LLLGSVFFCATFPLMPFIGGTELRAATDPDYGRIYDWEVDQVIYLFGALGQLTIQQE